MYCVLGTELSTEGMMETQTGSPPEGAYCKELTVYVHCGTYTLNQVSSNSLINLQPILIEGLIYTSPVLGTSLCPHGVCTLEWKTMKHAMAVED